MGCKAGRERRAGIGGQGRLGESNVTGRGRGRVRPGQATEAGRDRHSRRAGRGDRGEPGEALEAGWGRVRGRQWMRC